MEKHPLQFFQDLLDWQNLANLRDSFFHSNLASQADFIDKENEVIHGSILDDDEKEVTMVPFTQTFDMFLHNTVKKELKAIQKSIDVEVLSLKDSKLQQVFLQTLFLKLNYLISKVQTSDHLGKYPTVLIQLQDLKHELKAQYDITDKATSSESRKTPKIEWKGNLKVLLTLFYDLVKGQDGKDALIGAQITDIKDFISDNFLWDGDKISLETLKTTFTPGKISSRAMKGDRIELGNVKVIK